MKLHQGKGKNILIIHPEGNLNNNPNLSGIVEILCENGYVVDIFSLRSKKVMQRTLCSGSQMFIFDGIDDVNAGICLLASKVFSSPNELAMHIRNIYKDYDLIIGIDRGIIEASVIASVLKVPYGVISYEIFFADEAGAIFKQPEIQACESVSFAVCQDDVRSTYLSQENKIPLEKIINIPVAGRSVKHGNKSWYFNDKFGIDRKKKIALYAGSIHKWSMSQELADSVKQWDDNWILVFHNRYGFEDRLHSFYSYYKDNPKIFFSFDPCESFGEMNKLLHSADLGIALYRPLTQDIWAGNNLKYIGMASGKISTYLQYGLPLLINEIGEMSRYVEQYKLGISIKKDHSINPGLLQGYIHTYKERCYEFFKNKLDLNTTSIPLLNKIDSLLRKVQGDFCFGNSSIFTSENQASFNSLWSYIEKLPRMGFYSSIDLLNTQAKQALQNGELQRAKELLAKVLSLSPNNIKAFNNLAVTKILEKDWKSAQEMLQKVLRIDPSNNVALENTKYLETQTSQVVKESIEYLEQPLHVLKGKSSNIKVSAIVSTYNSERFIRGCLEDLTNQTLYKKGALEIIVIDSCSPQNERAIVEGFQKSHHNIVYVRTEKRETIYAAWNRAIKIAKGKYITNANTDDRHRKDGLEILANELDKNPDVVLVYGNQIITETENETFEHHKPVGVFQWPDFNRNYLLKVCNIGPQPMWRKSVHRESGYFDDIFQIAGDYEFWLRISPKYHFKHIPEYLGLYLRSPQSVEYRNQELTQQETLVIQEKYKKLKDIQEKPIAKVPLVSIIIPTYNRPGTLKIALESIIAQTYKFIETIVVNDAGIDVLNVIDTFRDRLSIKYFVHNINKDRSAARNTAIKHASGKYIAYLDDDDIFYPDHIETLVSFLETNNTYKVAYTDACRAFQEKEDGKYITKNKEVPYSFDFDYDLILAGNFIPTPCIMHYKSCIDTVGMFDETLGAHEDWDLWIRMSTKFQFAHIKKITCEYSWREDGSSTTFGRKEIMDSTRNIVLQRGIRIYREKQIRGLFNSAEALFQSGAYNEAIDAYKKAIETSPSPMQQLQTEETSHLFDAYYNLALSYVNTQKVDDAIATFQKAVELHNDDATIYNNLGVLYFKKKMNDDARRCFEKALAIDVNYTEAQQNLEKISSLKNS